MAGHAALHVNALFLKDLFPFALFCIPDLSHPLGIGLSDLSLNLYKADLKSAYLLRKVAFLLNLNLKLVGEQLDLGFISVSFPVVKVCLEFEVVIFVLKSSVLRLVKRRDRSDTFLALLDW
jgi:hypothetical protein